MRGILALLLGGFGVGAFLRRWRRQPSIPAGPDPAAELRERLAKARAEAATAPTETPVGTGEQRVSTSEAAVPLSAAPSGAVESTDVIGADEAEAAVADEPVVEDANGPEARRRALYESTRTRMDELS